MSSTSRVFLILFAVFGVGLIALGLVEAASGDKGNWVTASWNCRPDGIDKTQSDCISTGTQIEDNETEALVTVMGGVGLELAALACASTGIGAAARRPGPPQTFTMVPASAFPGGPPGGPMQGGPMPGAPMSGGPMPGSPVYQPLPPQPPQQQPWQS